jgi:hypothetical protein
LSLNGDDYLAPPPIYFAKRYPQILWITLWIARGISRECVLLPVCTLVLLKFSAIGFGKNFASKSLLQ